MNMNFKRVIVQGLRMYFAPLTGAYKEFETSTLALNEKSLGRGGTSEQSRQIRQH